MKHAIVEMERLKVPSGRRDLPLRRADLMWMVPRRNGRAFSCLTARGGGLP